MCGPPKKNETKSKICQKCHRYLKQIFSLNIKLSYFIYLTYEGFFANKVFTKVFFTAFQSDLAKLCLPVSCDLQIQLRMTKPQESPSLWREQKFGNEMKFCFVSKTFRGFAPVRSLIFSKLYGKVEFTKHFYRPGVDFIH
jgi:hypothetical protein